MADDEPSAELRALWAQQAAEADADRLAAKAAHYAPLVEAWAAMPEPTDGAQLIAALDDINGRTVVGGSHLVAIKDAVTYLREHNIWLAIKAGAAAGHPACAAAVDLNEDLRAETFDVGTSLVQGMLTLLVADNIITDEHRQALIAMGHDAVPWWQSVGLTSPVSVHDLIGAALITEEFAKSEGLF